jgi:arginyl-tRNA synthetase
MKYIKAQIENDFTETIKNLFGLDFILSIRENQTISSFDYQVDSAFALAKQLKKNPIEIADNIVAVIKDKDIYQEIQVSKPGFINIKISNLFLQSYLSQLLQDPLLGVEPTKDSKTINS